MSIDMFKNYILVALRNISRQKMYSALNIAGLAVGLAAFLLIALYVQYELSFDRYHRNADRIYRLVRDGKTLTPPPLGQALADNFTEIEAVARIIQDGNTLVSYGDKHFMEDDFYWAGADLFRVFTLPFVQGDPQNALRDQSSVVISQSTAKKYFGDRNPLGETLVINDTMDFKVTGVFEDMPANSHFIMNIVVPYLDYFRHNGADIEKWTSNYTYTYFLLREGADPKVLESDIHRVIEVPLLEKFGVPKPYPQVYFVQPILDIHLKSHRVQEISVNNDIMYIYLFSSIALLILFIACINYVNLATARSARRGKEVGLRKVVGARRSHLVQQFLGESVFIILLAFGLTLILVDLLLPSFNNLVERELSMRAMAEPWFLAGLVLTVCLVSLFAGGYPAVSISAFKPVQALKGPSSRGKSGRNLRYTLVLFQFFITTVLFICTLTIDRQLDFVNHYDVGYSKDHIVNVKVRDSNVRRNVDAVKTELLQIPGVTGVAASSRLPNDIDGFTSRALNPALPGEETTIFYNMADYDFIDLYDIEIVQGRNFSRDQVSDEEGAFLVNEAAVRAGQWASPLEHTLTHWNGETGRVVGVMRDFHFSSLHSPVEPLYIYLDPHGFSYLSIKFGSSDTPARLRAVERVMRSFSPNYPFEYAFFEQEFTRAYHPEQRMVNIFSSFAILAIGVACLGLFGLSAFAAQQRTREIGIRKILGASVSRITILLSREFINWVVLANLVAWPTAYVLMDRWLKNFSVRVDQSVVIFLASSLMALIIAILTVSVMSAKAAATKPIHSLRHDL